MLLTAELNGILYGTPEPTDFDEMASLLATSFSRNEPMAVAAGQTYAEVVAMIHLFKNQILTEGLSLISRESTTGRITGALLARDFESPLPSGMEEASPNFAPIGHLLNQLEEAYRKTRRSKPGRVLHLFMIGVDPEYVRQGIGITLTELTLQQRIKTEYKYVIAEATNHKSEGILRNLGFIPCAGIRYTEYLYSGQYVFRSIEPDEGAVLMEKELKAEHLKL